MDISNRIKQLRDSLGISQGVLGERIGVTRSSVCNYESGTRNLTEHVIKDICSEFNVNYSWLKEGIGDMFAYGDVHSLDTLAVDQGSSKEDIDFIKKYLRLSADARKIVRSILKEVL